MMLKNNNRPPSNNRRDVTNEDMFEKRKKNDMLFMRRKKLKDLLEEENEEYKFELISKGQNIPDRMNRYNNNVGNHNNYSYQQQKEIPQQVMYNNQRANEYREIRKSPQMNNDYYQQYMRQNNEMNMRNNMNYKPANYDANKELDYAIKRYADNFDKLKVDDFLSRKKIQDDLLNKINMKLAKINHDINDKIYQEQFAMQWETHKQPNGNQINTTTINN